MCDKAIASRSEVNCNLESTAVLVAVLHPEACSSQQLQSTDFLWFKSPKTHPEEDDYDEVAASLPVFCVSSRAYQRLMGRMKKDKDVHGFIDVDATEVPSLQRHCSMLKNPIERPPGNA